MTWAFKPGFDHRCLAEMTWRCVSEVFTHELPIVAASLHPLTCHGAIRTYMTKQVVRHHIAVVVARSFGKRGVPSERRCRPEASPCAAVVALRPHGVDSRNHRRELRGYGAGCNQRCWMIRRCNRARRPWCTAHQRQTDQAE